MSDAALVWDEVLDDEVDAVDVAADGLDPREAALWYAKWRCTVEGAPPGPTPTERALCVRDTDGQLHRYSVWVTARIQMTYRVGRRDRRTAVPHVAA